MCLHSNIYFSVSFILYIREMENVKQKFITKRQTDVYKQFRVFFVQLLKRHE